jgi:hypothetical protein
MSGDPERLLGAGSGAEPLERELLLSVRDVGPPRGAEDEAWRALAAQIAAGTAVGAATSSAAAAAGKTTTGGLVSWALSTKLAVVAVGSSLALSGGYFALRATERSPAVSPRPVVAPPSPSLSASFTAPVIGPSVPERLPEVVRAEGAPSRKPEPPRRDSLQAESALLMQARAQLRSGHPGEAQATLDRLQAQFPKGMLAQEREVLAIEVLAARGNAGGARQRARAFIKAFPKSPHSQKLARFAE